ncbi:MAG: hypothetical protein AB7S26_30070 [Sandaracinaceae bacterium]
MTTNWKKTTRILAAVALLGAIIACGGDDEDNSTTGATGDTTEGTAAAQPGAVAGGAPQPLTLGQPPVSIQVPVPPSFTLNVTAAAEYQVDATGSPMDPELFIYNGDELVENNDDGGDGLNARIVRFLPPGNYSVRVVEHRARAFTAQVQAQQLPPLTAVGAVTIGQPLVVTFPDFPLLQRPRNDRDAAKAVTLNVTAAGSYTCEAGADNGRDAKMAIISNGAILAEDDDSGEGNNARITQTLQPGSYEIRVWDWIRRGDMRITVTCTQG